MTIQTNESAPLCLECSTNIGLDPVPDVDLDGGEGGAGPDLLGDQGDMVLPSAGDDGQEGLARLGPLEDLEGSSDGGRHAVAVLDILEEV